VCVILYVYNVTAIYMYYYINQIHCTSIIICHVVYLCGFFSYITVAFYRRLSVADFLKNM